MALLALLALPAAASAASFSFTGDEQTYDVPAGVTAVHVVAAGAAGRAGSAGALGGAGGGASDVRTLSVADGGSSLCGTQSTSSLNSRLIVAGGGGGDGGGSFGAFGLGGAAGQAAGVNTCNNNDPDTAINC